MAKERIFFGRDIQKGRSPLVETAHLYPIDIHNKSPRNRLSVLFNTYLTCLKQISNLKVEKKPKPHISVVEENPQELLKAAQIMQKTALAKGNVNRVNKVRAFYRVLTIFQEGTGDRLTLRDPKTGIRVVHLKRGEPAYPMHPSPDF